MREWRNLEERHQHVAAAYSNGQPLKLIASRFGYSKTNVKRIARRWGCTPRPTGRPRSRQ